jgi:glycosyltransferase involved in cell wall biosynthesis
MIHQTITPTEIVIVEDGPVTIKIQGVFDRLKLQYPNLLKTIALERNMGLGEALRVGVLACNNEWIVRMDSDDYSVPQRCKMQFLAQQRENADMIGCDINEFTGVPQNVVAKRVFPEKHEDIYKFGRRRTPFAHPGIMMRKTKVLEAGNYRSAHLHEDYDLFIRMLMNGCRGYTVKQPLVYMRVSEDFYARRGGVPYLKTLLRNNIRLYKSGWMGVNDFIARSGANIITCLMPNRIRDLIYKKLLRK